MNTSHPVAENRIGSRKIDDQHITGPHWKPPSIPNATSYWRCSSCHRESIQKQDFYRATFHTPNCEVHEC